LYNKLNLPYWVWQNSEPEVSIICVCWVRSVAWIRGCGRWIRTFSQI